MDSLLYFEGTVWKAPSREPLRRSSSRRKSNKPKAEPRHVVLRQNTLSVYRNPDKSDQPEIATVVAARGCVDDKSFGFDVDVLYGKNAQQTDRFLVGNDETLQRSWLRALSACMAKDQYATIADIPMRRLGKRMEWKRIGEGTFGRVYSTTYDGSPVAIKRFKFEINFEEQADQEMAIQLVTEVAHMARMNHANLVRFYGIAVENEFYHIVTELCENGDLSERLHKWDASGTIVEGPGEPIDVSTQRRWGRELLNGIGFLHECGVIHRDLKPQNLLLDRNFSLKIADLGQSIAMDRKNMFLTAAPGTPLYQAPECMPSMRVTAPYSYSADMYSVGIIFYEICTLRVPFLADDDDISMADLPELVCGGARPIIPAEVPPGCASLILRCTAGDPLQRPTAQKALEWMTDRLLFDPLHVFDSKNAMGDSNPLSVLHEGVIDRLLKAVFTNFWSSHLESRDKLETCCYKLLKAYDHVSEGTAELLSVTLPRLDDVKESSFKKLVELLQEHLTDSENQALPLLCLEIVLKFATLTSSREHIVSMFVSSNGIRRITDILLARRERTTLLIPAIQVLALCFSNFATPTLQQSGEASRVEDDARKAMAEAGVGPTLVSCAKCNLSEAGLLGVCAAILEELAQLDSEQHVLMESGVVDALLSAMVNHQYIADLIKRCEGTLRILSAAHFDYYEQIQQACGGSTPNVRSFAASLRQPLKREHIGDALLDTPTDEDVIYNVALLGTSGVGKTSIYRRFFAEGFKEESNPTFGTSSNFKRLILDGKRILLNINDTAGLERFQALSPLYYQRCHGAILVYRRDNQQSFDLMKEFAIQLRRFSPSACIHIAGNFLDAQRPTVDEDLASRYASSLHAQHSLVSAKQNINIAAMLDCLVRRIANEHKGIPVSGDIVKAKRDGNCWVL